MGKYVNREQKQVLSFQIKTVIIDEYHMDKIWTTLGNEVVESASYDT